MRLHEALFDGSSRGTRSIRLRLSAAGDQFSLTRQLPRIAGLLLEQLDLAPLLLHLAIAFLARSSFLSR
jgi:hypothetical protein